VELSELNDRLVWRELYLLKTGKLGKRMQKVAERSDSHKKQFRASWAITSHWVELWSWSGEA